MTDRPQHRLSRKAAAGTVVAALITPALVYAGAGWIGATRMAAIVSATIAFLAVFLGGLRRGGMRPVEPATGNSSEDNPRAWDAMFNPRQPWRSTSLKDFGSLPRPEDRK